MQTPGTPSRTPRARTSTQHPTRRLPRPLLLPLIALAAALLSACGTESAVTALPASPHATLEIEVDLGAAALAPRAAALATATAPAPAEGDGRVTAFGDANRGAASLLGLADLHAVSRGAGAVVAVIDSGVDADLPEFAGALLPGWDFVEGDADPQDESGHGSAVAALIAGENGFAPEARLLPLRVLGAGDHGSAADAAEAVLFAVDRHPTLRNPTPARIVNLSLGGGYHAGLHEAIRTAVEAGALVIAASGNAGRDLAYPAALPETLAVGAGDVANGTWRPTPYSNRGAGLELIAPMGGATETTGGSWSGDGVEGAGARRWHGTSFAAAQASGAAALLHAAGAPAGALRSLLAHGAGDVAASGWDAGTGFGVLDPGGALRAARGATAPGVAVRVLDAGSAQEVAFAAGEHVRLELAPGDYRLLVWFDADGDGLRSEGEPGRLLERGVRLERGERTALSVDL